MQPKKKKCKGIGKSKGYGCGNIDYPHKYGLCKDCFIDWIYNTPEGREVLEKSKIKAKKQVHKKPKRKYIKWQEKPLNEMITYVQNEICNKYIRLRDQENFGRCISSGGQIHDAGHYYTRGAHPGLRFSPQNIHGQNRGDNTYKSANIHDYTEGLLQRFGKWYVDELEQLKVDYSKDKNFTREYIKHVGETYKYLIDSHIWVFRQKEFDKYLKIVNNL